MDRLNIVIADSDCEYAAKLTEFLISRYSSRFSVTKVTSAYLEQNVSVLRDVQVLLVDRKTAEKVRSDNVFSGVTIILDDEKTIPGGVKELPPEKAGFAPKTGSLFKYQDGETIINSVLDIYSQFSEMPVFAAANNNRQSRVIGVYSPCGGIGKSTVALALCMQGAKRGLKPLYLNFMGWGVFNDSERNFSRILLAIDNTDNSLLEALLRKDKASGIYYYTLPDSCLEFGEISDEKTACLFKRIIDSGLYDVIVLDMSNEFNDRNLSLISLCDRICLLTGNDALSRFKVERLENEIKVLEINKGVQKLSESIFVVNRIYGNFSAGEKRPVFFGNEAAEEIPFCPVLRETAGPDDLANLSSDFYAAISRLFNRLRQ